MFVDAPMQCRVREVVIVLCTLYVVRSTDVVVLLRISCSDACPTLAGQQVPLTSSRALADPPTPKVYSFPSLPQVFALVENLGKSPTVFPKLETPQTYVVRVSIFKSLHSRSRHNVIEVYYVLTHSRDSTGQERNRQPHSALPCRTQK